MALAFDGVNDNVSYGDIAGVSGSSVLSFATWIFLNEVANNNDGIVTKSATIPFLFGMSGDIGGRIQFRGAGTGRSYTANSITQSAWEHWAFVYNGFGATNDDKIKIYKNGVLETLTHAVAQAGTLAAGAGNIVLAGPTASQFPACYLAHVKMWLDVLDAETIRREVNNYVPSNPATLILWAPLDDGILAKDYSRLINTSTVTEATAIAGPTNTINYGDQVLNPTKRRTNKSLRQKLDRFGMPVPLYTRGP